MSAPIEGGQDLAWQRVEWRAQRIGWVCLGLVVLAAGAGLLGPGPLGRARAGEPGGLAVEYYRVERREAPTTLLVTVPADAVQAGTVGLTLDRAYARMVVLEHMTPEPAATEVRPADLFYRFRAGTGGPLEIKLTVRFEHAGFAVGRLGLTDGRVVAFRQLVLP
jgi:hypothetical protein